MWINMLTIKCTILHCNIIWGSGLEIGGDYTHYTSNNNQRLYANYQDGNQSSFSMVGGQKIDRYSIYADRKQSLPKGWNLGYGVSYRFAKDIDFQTYDKVTGNIQTQNTYSNLREQTTSFYVSLSKKLYNRYVFIRFRYGRILYDWQLS